jgi:hypothetical protein
MKRFRPARTLAIFVIALTGAGTALAAVSFTRQDSDSFKRKLGVIVGHATVQAKSPRETPVSEREVNAYIHHEAASQIPVGVVDPYIAILGNGRLSGRAIVDLDRVRQAKSSGGWLDPASYLTGKLPVTATGTLHTKAGQGRFVLESAEISGVTVPKFFLQELLTYYSRTEENPTGINMDDPFELPAEIREIRVGKGQAVVVQ